MTKEKTKVFIIYSSILFGLSLLSLIGLAFNVYEVFLVLIISSSFAIITQYLTLKWSNKSEAVVSKIQVFLLVGGRFLMIILGVVLPAICIYFLKDLSNLGDYRYLFLLFCLVPHFTSLIFLFIGTKEDESTI